MPKNVVCQPFSEDLLDIQDVDKEDDDDSNLCSNYVKDIYKYLRDLEVGRSRSGCQLQ